MIDNNIFIASISIFDNSVCI